METTGMEKLKEPALSIEVSSRRMDFLGWVFPIVKQMNANHVQRGLRSVEANRVAITWIHRGTLLHSRGMRYSHMDRAHWFFFAAAARPRNSRNPYAHHAVRPATTPFGEKYRHFRAHRALG